MLGLSNTIGNLILYIVIAIWLLSLGMSFLIMIGGNKIFEKAHKDPKSAYYPILNLFVMFEVVEMSSFLGILLFIPIINLIPLITMLYKLGKIFNTSTLFIIGLIIMPVIFYPVLAFSKRKYNMIDEETFKALDSARGESIHLMTQEEINQENSIVEEEFPNVDSIFKADLKVREDVSPYKAVKIDEETLKKMKDNTPEEDMFIPIEKKEIILQETKSDETIASNEEIKPKSKFTNELEENTEVEFLDL